MKIRELGPTDLATFRSMLSVFGTAFDDVDTYTSKQPDDRYLEKLLSRDHFIALVAEARDVVVGALVAYELEKFEQQRSEIYIYDLAVDEKHRRMGIATRLISDLESRAARRGAYVIFVQADQDDEPAIALYESLGTREDVLHFDIAIR